MRRGKAVLILILVVLGGSVVSLLMLGIAKPLFLQETPDTEPSTSLPKQIIASNYAWVEEKGVRLTLNHSGLNIRLGDIFNYTTEVRNINSPSRLAIAWSIGQIWMKVYDENGTTVRQVSGVYARGPPGPPKEIFFKGQSWSVQGFWDTARNLPNEMTPVELTPGNYTLVVTGRYLDLDLDVREIIELRLPLKIAAVEKTFDLPNGFSEAVEKVSLDSVRVEIRDVVSGKSIVVDRGDPRFEEVLGYLKTSPLKKITHKTKTIVEENQTATVSVTIPYPWGRVLYFELKDGSKIWFNCATENVWFETDQAIYQASFDPVFRAFLDEILDG